MTVNRNPLGQPVGSPLAYWTARSAPPRSAMEGRFCRLEPLDPDRHAADFHAATRADGEGRIWTYLPYGPFEMLEEFRNWMRVSCAGDDPFFHAITEQESGRALGVASYLRIDTRAGVIEVGHINYAPALQRTAAATEAMYLMMRRVFAELGYRRYEWKCDALNAPSRAAAERLGFTFEGIFRQATIYKGRNRDTAWYSIIDQDWPALEAAFERWLAPANFDAAGRQRESLSALTGAALGRSSPVSG
ncbi:GNAT family N-acetyltransferase [Rhodospirillaceae bacterium SYSU D60014]|uniref:GNAT family N-acetyltransferase n=1 Tax=Virgifigura deserti TaxID=2268457 RepID=UPI000E668457